MTDEERCAAVFDAAVAFVRAHCELEDLAKKIGIGAASASALNDRVIDLHLELERAVLGDERVPGRRWRQCERCKGTGWGEAVPITAGLASCSECNGKGII